MFTIEEVSDAEHSLILNAQQEHGRYFTNAYNYASLLCNFIYNIKAGTNLAFLPFISQVRTSIYLTLLSTIRKHDVQAMMMLRHALESGVLAGYSLDNNCDFQDFCNTSSDGFLVLKPSAKDKAYKWIDNNYKKHSDFIKFCKNDINTNSAHSSIAHGFLNTDFSVDAEINITLFDGNQGDTEHFNIMIKQRLWFIGNISICLLDLFANIVEKHPYLILIDSFKSDMAMLGNENDALKSELMKHSRFSKGVF